MENFLEKYKLPGSKLNQGARFGSTYTKIGMIQRRLAWPLRKDDTQFCQAFHIKKKTKTEPGRNRTS